MLPGFGPMLALSGLKHARQAQQPGERFLLSRNLGEILFQLTAHTLGCANNHDL